MSAPLPSFSDSFWSSDYSQGLSILFDKLHQGCTENEEVLALAHARAEAEEQYGRKLQDLPVSFAPKRQGFGKDDGASLKRAYEGIVGEMGEEGQKHIQVAENIRRMVLVPFTKWADEHQQRVDYSHSVLKQRLKKYEKELSEVQKCQKRYFNKCRVLEDFNESGEAELTTAPSTPAMTEKNGEYQSPSSTAAALEEANATMANIADDPVELGEEIYSPEEAQHLFNRMLDEIGQKSLKIAILGTYDNVSTGDQVVKWLMDSKVCKDLAESEKFGQNLVNSGYLRLVGQVGSKFANSSVFNYQWRKKAYLQAGRQVTDTGASFVGGYLGDTINNYINNPHPDETPEERLRREVTELDMRYRGSVSRLDDLRCSLEEAVIDHLKFMDRCEYDRLKAVKAVFLDFLATLSNVVPSYQAAVDKELLFQETIHPANDLRYILESYRTGSFSPKVTVYDNYYNSTEDQTFGVDLELRCRGDRKRVPYVVSTILHHMDNQYPDLENDEVRLGVWTVSVPLNSTHRLRKQLNTGQQFPREVLQEYEGPIVASVLKLYLVELPDSLIPSQYYDIIKTIYAQHGNDEDPSPRISAVQNTLAQMRVSNIATLDAITTHLTRLISITKAGPEYVQKLAQEFSHCILRARGQSSLTIADRHSFRLVYDLLTYKDAIFSGLKRNNSSSKNASRQNSAKVEEPPQSQHVRRPTLQNRLDALSLKIRKSNTKTNEYEGSNDGGEQHANGDQEGHEGSQEYHEYHQAQDGDDDANSVQSSPTEEHPPYAAARHNESLTGDTSYDNNDPVIKAEGAQDEPVSSHEHSRDHGSETNPVVID